MATWIGAPTTVVSTGTRISPPPTPTNAPPQPDFDAHCDHGTCAFTDKSKDDDGAVVSWA